MKRYLITGGAGFIGSHIAEELARRGENVRILDNFSTGKRENLASIQEAVEVVEGDVRDYQTVLAAVKNVDIVLHQAALPSVPRSIKDPSGTNEVNVNGTVNILKAAAECDVERVVNASSSSVYGDAPVLPKHEEMRTMPLSPYAVSKLAAETYCTVFARVYGLQTISLRYFNVFGPRQDPNSQYSAVIPKFITAAIAGTQPTIYGDGEQTRDFTYVENVVSANLLASVAKNASGSVLNCACSNQISLNQLVREIAAALGHEVLPRYEKPRLGEVRHSFASIAQARDTIGYVPLIDFKEGLKRTIDWYLHHPKG